MKLFTLNTHSLVEGEGEYQASVLAEAILDEGFDVIALQEVNQPRNAAAIEADKLWHFTACSEQIPLREGNFAYAVICALASAGAHYHWCYLPVKIGYGKYDEGLAFLCRTPILAWDSALLSLRSDYDNWKTRRMLCVRTEGYEDWFFNLHLGWWEDEEEPFVAHWARLLPHLSDKKRYWLMGDMNAPAELEGEGYDLFRNSGLYDAYALAEQRSGEGTARARIDGWRDRGTFADWLRIDQIWSSHARRILSCNTMLDGVRYPVISDHFGVAVTAEEVE